MSRAILLLFVLSTSPVFGTMIDFETDGAGSPIVPVPFFASRITSNEYSSQGLAEIRTSESSIPFLNDTNTRNVGTAITGNYLNVGSVSSVDTFLELNFSPGIFDLAFDWATGTGADSISIALFGIGDVPLNTFIDPEDTTFINNAGFTVPSGSFSGDADGAEIRRVIIENPPNSGINGLILDNLQFSHIPEPTTLTAMALGSLMLLRRRRVA